MLMLNVVYVNAACVMDGNVLLCVVALVALDVKEEYCMLKVNGSSQLTVNPRTLVSNVL